MKYIIPKGIPIQGKAPHFNRDSNEWVDYTTTKDHIFDSWDIIYDTPNVDYMIFSVFDSNKNHWHLKVHKTKIVIHDKA